MGFLTNLFGKKVNLHVLSDNDIIEASAYPNCWEYQEYDGEFVAYVEDQTKSNINQYKQRQKAFIQQFVETNVTGIRLKKDGNQQFCSKCKTKYKHISSYTS